MPITLLTRFFDVTAMQAQVTALQTQLATAQGQIPTLEAGAAVLPLSGTWGTATLGASIGAAATYDVTVTFNATLPTATYTALVSIEGAAGLLGVFVSQVKSKLTTACVVSIKNTGLVSIGSGAVVRVVAII